MPFCLLQLGTVSQSFIIFMTLTLLKITGQLFHRTSVQLHFSDNVFTTLFWMCRSGRTIPQAMLFFSLHPGTLREILAVTWHSFFPSAILWACALELNIFFNILFLVRCSPYKVVHQLLPILLNDLSSFAVIIYFDVQRVPGLASGGPFIWLQVLLILVKK